MKSNRKQYEKNVALLVTDDPALVAMIRSMINPSLSLELIPMLKTDMPALLRMNTPAFILWDYRTISERERSLLAWGHQRMYLSPIVVCVEEESSSVVSHLYRIGINLILELESPDAMLHLNDLIEHILDSSRTKRSNAGSGPSIRGLCYPLFF